MIKNYILIIATCTLVLGQSAAGQVTIPSTIKQQIEQVENNLAGRIIINGKPYNILDRMAFYKVKGLSIAVVENYKIVWAKGYGWADENEKRPITTTTLFKPGSISKSLNAVGVLKLADARKLDIYSDINKYLKSWEFPYDSLSKGKKITTANLLSHTGGLSVYGGFPGYDRKNMIPTLPQVLDGVPPANTPAVRSLFEPGLQFQYSGGGTIISQLLITDITHQLYEKYMSSSVLKPLGMLNSFYSTNPPTTELLSKIAKGYTVDGEETQATYRVYPEQAPLGLWTNPTELGKFMIEAQKAFNGKATKVINPKMAQLLLTPYIDNSATMGAFIGERNGGEKYFFHDAGNEGYRGLYYGSVKGGNGIVAFVNSDDGNILIELLTSVATVYNWKGFDKPLSVNTINVPESITNKYPGVYLYEGKLAEVIKDKDGLTYWADNQTSKMYFTSEKEFINIEFPTVKSFIVDTKGETVGYSRKLNGKEFPAATKVVVVDTIKTNEGQLTAFGWHLLESKRYNEAIQYLNRGRELEPTDNSIISSTAHCYLFKNEYAKAITLYKEFISRNPNDPASQKNSLKEELSYFRKKGFDKEVMEKVIAELNL